MCEIINNLDIFDSTLDIKELAHKYAISKITRDLEQGFQSLEYNLNTVASSRGDFIFTTLTFGLDERPFAKLVSSIILKVRKEGQGKEGYKKPAIFPKLVFLYDKDKHSEGNILHDLFLEAVDCSCKAQYPDFLSLTGDGYVSDIYKKYKNGVMRWYLGKDNKVKENENWVDNVISPMGCRAYLSPYYKEGGQQPLNENDKPVFTGRFNSGAISINFPMIFMKAKEENKDFFEVLEYYLQIIRKIHIKTKEQVGKFRASANPLAYTQGGFYKGNLKSYQSIESLLDYSTFSFGITALNELQELYNGKQINEDNEFAYKALLYVNDFAEKYKKKTLP